MVLKFMALKTSSRRIRKRAAAMAGGPICAVLLSGFVAASEPAGSDEVSRGAYLARAADCVSCHTADPQAPRFAGGLPINSPFGIIYSTNITPDPVNGIGRYTLNDFSRAVRNGIAGDGRRLYPAMPYPSFAAISDEDIRALYAYFMQAVAPVNHKPPETRLPFPFNWRWSLIIWNALFAGQEPYRPRGDHDERWNRGAYLVRSLGHCGACHTPRGLAYQETAYAESSARYLSGAEVDNWYAANLTGDMASGLGLWSEAEIAAFLETGHGGRMAAFGSMIPVIENSTQYLSKDDLNAIAVYLKSLPAHGEKSAYKPGTTAVAMALSAQASGEMELPGLGIYNAFCQKCHQIGGSGEAGKFPRLAGNSIVASENPNSLIRLLLEGGKTAQTRKQPDPWEMPGFTGKLSDLQIAEVLSYIRNSWGNAASPVTERQVAALRNALQTK